MDWFIMLQLYLTLLQIGVNTAVIWG